MKKSFCFTILFNILGTCVSALNAQTWTNIWSLDLSQLTPGDIVSTENTNIDYVTPLETTKNVVYKAVENNGKIGITTERYGDDSSQLYESSTLSKDLGLEFYTKLGGYEYGKTVLKISGDLTTVNRDGGSDTWFGMSFRQKGSTYDILTDSAPLMRFTYEHVAIHSGLDSANSNFMERIPNTVSTGNNLTFEIILDTTKQSTNPDEWFWYEVTINNADTGDKLFTKEGYMMAPTDTSLLDNFWAETFNFGNYLYYANDVPTQDGATLYALSVDAYNIPEPSAYAAILGLICLPALLLRRRK